MIWTRTRIPVTRTLNVVNGNRGEETSLHLPRKAKARNKTTQTKCRSSAPPGKSCRDQVRLLFLKVLRTSSHTFVCHLDRNSLSSNEGQRPLRLTTPSLTTMDDFDPMPNQEGNQIRALNPDHDDLAIRPIAIDPGRSSPPSRRPTAGVSSTTLEAVLPETVKNAPRSSIRTVEFETRIWDSETSRKEFVCLVDLKVPYTTCSRLLGNGSALLSRPACMRLCRKQSVGLRPHCLF